MPPPTEVMSELCRPWLATYYVVLRRPLRIGTIISNNAIYEVLRFLVTLVPQVLRTSYSNAIHVGSRRRLVSLLQLERIWEMSP